MQVSMMLSEKSLWSVIFNCLFKKKFKFKLKKILPVLRSSLKSLSHFTRKCPICEKVMISFVFSDLFSLLSSRKNNHCSMLLAVQENI